MRSSALLSADGRYRFCLERDWGGGPPALWIMLNPSTAGVEVDDPTIKRVMEFTTRWGLGAIAVVNLYPLRSPDPKALRSAGIPSSVLTENYDHLLRHMIEAKLVVAAWGTPKAPGRNVIVNNICMDAALRGIDLICLGTTADGSPRHPSPLGQVPMDTKPQIWRRSDGA